MRTPTVLKPLPTDPEISGSINVSLNLPSWVYWRMVNTAESEAQEISELFYLACRAILSDFSAVEAIALKKLVTRYTEEGYSDPQIAEMLDLPVRRVRKIRSFFGIKSAKERKSEKSRS